MAAAEKKASLFLRGVPTGPDVDRLMTVYAGIKQGDLILYEDVAKKLNLDQVKDRYRFQTVTLAWRKRLRNDKNLELRGEVGVHFRVLTDPERVPHAGGKIRTGLRRIRDGVGVASGTNETALTADERNINLANKRIGASLLAHARSQARALKTKLPQLGMSTGGHKENR